MVFNHVTMQTSILDIRNLKKLLSLSNQQVSSESPLYDHHHNSISPSSSALSSSSVIGNNNDILTQLLLYLPRKSLCRFKCVSKQWSSLISDAYFIQKRRYYRKYRHHRSIQGLFLHKYWLNEYGNNFPEFEFISIDSDVRNVVTVSRNLNFANDPGGIQIEQSCNGLLLCSTFGICNNIAEFARNYYVYNPTTGRYTILPSSEYRKPGYESCFSVSLAFNPFRSPHYKVVCISESDKADECQIEIYYSETCTWRLVGYSCSLTNIYGRGVYWNGLLNWHNVHDSLVYFDIDRELIGVVSMPDRTTVKNSLYFGVCKGRLYYVETDCTGWANVSSLNIFEMKTDCTGWNVMYHVDLWKLRVLLHLQEIGYSNFENDELKVLLVDGEEGEEDEEEDSPKLVFQVRDKVISYDLKESSLSKVHDIEPVFIRGHWQQCRIFHAYQYINSLASA